jgi:hypothetical protein
MVEIGYRYQELYWAGVDSNWEYADYQVKRIDLALENALERRPKRRASADTLFVTTLNEVKQAIASRERAAFAVAIPLAWIIGEPAASSLLAVLLGLFMFVALAYVSVAIGIKCEVCRERLLVDRPWSTRSVLSEREGFRGFANVVLAVLRHGRFRCPYCSQSFTVRRAASV